MNVESLFAQRGCRLVDLGLIPRAGQDRDALFCELTGCFQTDAFVGAGNQGNFLGAHEGVPRELQYEEHHEPGGREHRAGRQKTPAGITLAQLVRKVVRN